MNERVAKLLIVHEIYKELSLHRNVYFMQIKLRQQLRRRGVQHNVPEREVLLFLPRTKFGEEKLSRQISVLEADIKKLFEMF